MVLYWNYIVTGRVDISGERGEKYSMTVSRPFPKPRCYLWNLKAQIKIERWGIYYF
jgi:hypothetical protein